MNTEQKPKLVEHLITIKVRENLEITLNIEEAKEVLAILRTELEPGYFPFNPTNGIPKDFKPLWELSQNGEGTGR